MTAACFVGAALRPGRADPPVSALAVAAAGARPSRRDALGRAPAVVFALLFAICPSVRHGAPRAVTATTPQSAWRQRGGRAHPPPPSGPVRNEPKSSPIWRRADAIRRGPETVRTRLLEGSAAVRSARG